MKKKGWTMKDVDALIAKGAKVKFIDKSPIMANSPCFKNEPKALNAIKETLTRLDIEFTEEYRFHKVRRFRFDVAIPDKRLAVEYEGVFGGKSRHTTVGGYNRDCTKYNLAALEGWTVLRYTASNYGDFPKDLNTFLNSNT